MFAGISQAQASKKSRFLVFRVVFFQAVYWLLYSKDQVGMQHGGVEGE